MPGPPPLPLPVCVSFLWATPSWRLSRSHAGCRGLEPICKGNPKIEPGQQAPEHTPGPWAESQGWAAALPAAHQHCQLPCRRAVGAGRAHGCSRLGMLAALGQQLCCGRTQRATLQRGEGCCCSQPEPWSPSGCRGSLPSRCQPLQRNFPEAFPCRPASSVPARHIWPGEPGGCVSPARREAGRQPGGRCQHSAVPPGSCCHPHCCPSSTALPGHPEGPQWQWA